MNAVQIRCAQIDPPEILHQEWCAIRPHPLCAGRRRRAFTGRQVLVALAPSAANVTTPWAVPAAPGNGCPSASSRSPGGPERDRELPRNTHTDGRLDRGRDGARLYPPAINGWRSRRGRHPDTNSWVTSTLALGLYTWPPEPLIGSAPSHRPARRQRGVNSGQPIPAGRTAARGSCRHRRPTPGPRGPSPGRGRCPPPRLARHRGWLRPPHTAPFWG